MFALEIAIDKEQASNIAPVEKEDTEWKISLYRQDFVKDFELY